MHIDQDNEPNDEPANAADAKHATDAEHGGRRREGPPARRAGQPAAPDDGRSAKLQQNVARFRLYRHRFFFFFTIFARKYAFCSIFQNLPDYQAEIFEIWQKIANFATFAKVLLNFNEN